MNLLSTTLMLFSAYLIGSIPFGYLIGRFKGIDIRTQGSGNIGATNVGRVLGRRWGMLAFALDVLKGLIPTLVGGMWIKSTVVALTAGGYGLWLLIAMVTILGHVFPIFLRFKGGKGVATALGAVMGIYPDLTWPGLVAFLIWAVVTSRTRYVSAGSLAAAVAFPILVCALHPLISDQPLLTQWPIVAFSIALTLLVIIRHRANIRRLRQGTENKL